MDTEPDRASETRLLVPPRPRLYTRRYGPKDLDRQIERLKDTWPSLDVDPAWRIARQLKGTTFPEWIEAPFCLVNPNFFGEYHVAVHEMLAALRKSRNKKRFCDRITDRYSKGRPLQETLRRSSHTRRFEMLLREQQPGPLWIVPAQFGLLHRGRSVSAVRGSYGPREFGFGVLEVAAMILTHQKRFVYWSALQAECPGDEVSPDPATGHTFAPFFQIYSGELSLDAFYADCEFEGAGSVTGYLPQL